MRAWTGFIWLTIGENGGLGICERHIRSRLKPYVTLRCYSSDVQVSSRTDLGSVPGNLMWGSWRTERHRSRFQCFLVFPQLRSISPAIHDHVSPPDDARDNPQQKTRHYILSLQWGASSLPRYWAGYRVRNLRFKSSGTLSIFDWEIVTDVWEVRSAFTVGVLKSRGTMSYSRSQY